MKLKKNKYLIILAGGKSQMPLIYAAKKLDLNLIIVDRNKDCPGKMFADIFINSSTDNHEKIILYLKKKKIKKNHIAGIITRSSGRSTKTMSMLQKKFKLDGTNPNSVETVLNKNKLMSFCKNKKILAPYTLIKRVDKKIPKVVNFPLVVKPSFATIGKTGISIVENNEDWAQAISLAQKYTENKYINIEEKIEGKDIVVIGLVKNHRFSRLCIIDEMNKVVKNKILRNGYRNPSIHTSVFAEKKINLITNKIVKELKINNCPLSISLKINDSGIVYLIEINLEISGELIHEKLLKIKNKKFNSFEWYLKNLFLNSKIRTPKKFLNKSIFINDKMLYD